MRPHQERRGNHWSALRGAGVLDHPLLFCRPAHSHAQYLLFVLWQLERFWLAALLFADLVTVVLSVVPLGERIAFVLATGLALILQYWSYDVQFFRAAQEATGLPMVVLCGAAGYWRLP